MNDYIQGEFTMQTQTEVETSMLKENLLQLQDVHGGKLETAPLTSVAYSDSK